METDERRLHVLSVCRAHVPTPFVQNMLKGASPEALPWRDHFANTPEQCAAAIRRGILKRKRTVVAPRMAWLLVAAERLLSATTLSLMTRTLSGGGGK